MMFWSRACSNQIFLNSFKAIQYLVFGPVNIVDYDFSRWESWNNFSCKVILVVAPIFINKFRCFRFNTAYLLFCWLFFLFIYKHYKFLSLLLKLLDDKFFVTSVIIVHNNHIDFSNRCFYLSLSFQKISVTH